MALYHGKFIYSGFTMPFYKRNHHISQNFTQCCESGSGIRSFFDPWLRNGKNSDPGWKKSDPGSGINIPG
jgi:hypothetical protein